MTAKMDALQVVARGKAEFIRTTIPELLEGHAIVQPRHVTLCGSDVWMLSHAPDAAYPFPPGTTGHEVIAEILAQVYKSHAYYFHRLKARRLLAKPVN